MICSIEKFCHISVEFLAKLRILDLPEEHQVMSEGYKGVIHIHAIQSDMEISSVEALIEPISKKKIVQKFLKANTEGIVKILT